FEMSDGVKAHVKETARLYREAMKLQILFNTPQLRPDTFPDELTEDKFPEGLKTILSKEQDRKEQLFAINLQITLNNINRAYPNKLAIAQPLYFAVSHQSPIITIGEDRKQAQENVDHALKSIIDSVYMPNIKLNTDYYTEHFNM